MALNFIWMDYALRSASLLRAPERVIITRSGARNWLQYLNVLKKVRFIGSLYKTIVQAATEKLS